MCKTMYWSERGPTERIYIHFQFWAVDLCFSRNTWLTGDIFNSKTRVKPSTVSLTCCDLHNFAIWISFCSFCWANFEESIWEGTTTSIIWHFYKWHVFCLRAVCTPTGSSIQVMSATFGSWLVLITELDFIRASAVSAAFFFLENTSVVSLLMEKCCVPFQFLFRCECFQSKCVLKCRVPQSWY